MALYDWLVSLLRGHPGWYDPICSACGKRHPGRVRTDGREYVEYNVRCSRAPGGKGEQKGE